MQHETPHALKENIDWFNYMKIKSMYVEQKKNCKKDKEKSENWEDYNIYDRKRVSIHNL